VSSLNYFEETKNYEVEFKSLNPSDAIQKKIKLKLERLVEEAPSRAFASLIIEKRNNNYFGQLKIESIKRNFTVECSNSSIEILLSKIEASMKEQLNQWRKTRFLDLTFKPTHLPNQPA
tara:strand:- start:36345 stop:36701 length:357 start_codon:yes stop_codon:yes gene_type:complete